MASRGMIYREQTPEIFLTDAEILSKVTSQSEIARKTRASARKRILMDDFRDQVDAQLKHMFVEPSYLVMQKYIDVSSNLMMRLMKDTSKVYKNEPNRTVDNEAGQKRYEEINEANHIDLFLDRANYLLNGMNDLIIQTLTYDKHIERSMLTPDQVTVFENDIDPTVPEALVVEYPGWNHAENRMESEFVFWSPLRHFTFKVKDGQMLKASVNELDLNPYAEVNRTEQAFYPFTFCHASHRENAFYDDKTGRGLVEATILIAIQNTFKYFMIPQQFKQLAVKFAQNTDKDYQNEQLSNPLHIFSTNGDIVTIDWQSAIKELSEVIEAKTISVANDYGLSSDQFKMQASVQSGFALKVQRQALDEKRSDQIKFWRINERELFFCARAANNLFKLGTVIPDTAQIKVDFAEPVEISDPMEELKVNQERIKLGILSPIDLIMRENPDLKTRDEALKKMQENIDDRNLVESRFGLNFGSLDQLLNPETGAGAPAAGAPAK